MLVLPAKDPDEVVTYTIDWERHPLWQRNDAIASATFSLTTAAGMAIDSSNHNSDSQSWAIVSGGTDESRGKLLCEIETTGGQTLQRLATILVRAR